MRNLLFFDTETTGIPRNYRAAVTDLDNWPRMVQIAWQQIDASGRTCSSGTYIIRPVGYTIPDDAARVHGITTARALREGHPLDEVLAGFAKAVASSYFLVAHNIDFDEKIVGAELLREQSTCRLEDLTKVCTMKASTNYCNLPGRYGPKWPTLTELHQKLFGCAPTETHDAAADIEATIRCFWEMIRLGVLRLDGVGKPSSQPMLPF